MIGIIPPLVAGSGLQILQTVKRNGALIVQANLSGLGYEVWRHVGAGQPDVLTDSSGVNITNAVFDTPLASGHNLRYDIPAEAFVTPGIYEIVTEFTLTGGATFRDVQTRRITHAPA